MSVQEIRELYIKMKWNKDDALRYVLDFLMSKGYTGATIVKRNKFGHALIKTKTKTFYFLFKKDHFRSFNYEFPDYVKLPNTFKGLGESINLEYLKFALNNKAKLLFCYEQMIYKIYTPSRRKLLNLLGFCYPGADFSQNPTTALLKIYCDHYGLVRTQDRENVYMLDNYSKSKMVVNETTYSFAFKIMERFK